MSLFKKTVKNPWMFWFNTLSKSINHTNLSTFHTVSFNFLSLPFHPPCVLFYYYIHSTRCSVVVSSSSRWNFSIPFEISNIVWDTVEGRSKCNEDKTQFCNWVGLSYWWELLEYWKISASTLVKMYCFLALIFFFLKKLNRFEKKTVWHIIFDRIAYNFKYVFEGSEGLL